MISLKTNGVLGRLEKILALRIVLGGHGDLLRQELD